MKNSYTAPWRKLALTALLGLGSTGAFAQALNYTAANARNLAGTYTDLGTSGSVITTANTDAANSAATPIGFSFTFNGTAFTEFTLNTNGLIKLGNTPVSDPTVTNYVAATDLNIVAPAGGIDLVGAANQTTSPTEYRVFTSGTAGSRVCTIQFENVADKPVAGASQFATMQFQIKLYETSNTIEFVYGAWTAGTATPIGLGFLVGLKGSSSAFADRLFAQKASSATAWTTTVFAQESGGLIPSHFVRNTFLPDAGRTYRFTSPTCLAPTGVTFTNTTTTGTTVNFTAPTNGTGYTIIYGAPGFNPASAGTTVTTPSSPYTFTGLTASTSYQLYIRANCGATDQSSLAGPFTFSTTCTAPIINTFPYTENFDGVPTGTLPCGFTVANTNGDSVTWRNRATVPGATGPIVISASSPNAMTYYYNEDATTAANDWFFTPALFLRQGGTYKLSFQYRNSGANFPESMEVKYGNAATVAGQTTTLWTNRAIATTAFTTANETSTPAVANITPATTGNYYIGFHVNSPADQFFLAIDNLSIAGILGTSSALNKAVSMFPNPSTGMVTLDVRGANAKNNLQVSVMNMLGQTVHTASLKDNFENQLNLSSLANGVYLLKVQTGSDFTTRQLTIAK
ncbi:T9SS type A sorting domain-containing protein [Microvirga sp. STR05]|uniref:T9SS type A sorting domain-containing protein n=1 Tax=Hymenobacter duratus TaxID=2771356 RepID=A0ABR8JGR6_9BACT|nr:T9SS type A sorting domain-containing protein [Hymenobacter duratus]MBD2716046.1 T9SS type A sorting domain-containing protein [Hymenobacter duratus]MBR7950960.1 T9SS type A sorting domain-containing protein [Microvirga sp. STR05]